MSNHKLTKSKDSNKEITTKVDLEEFQKNLSILNIVPPWDKRNTAEVVNDLVSYRYQDTFAQLLDKLKKQRLALAEAQLRKAAHKNMNKRQFGVELQYLKYIDDSYDDIPDSESSISIEITEEEEESKKENSDLELASKAKKYSLDFNLLSLKLQTLKLSYENELPNDGVSVGEITVSFFFLF